MPAVARASSDPGTSQLHHTNQRFLTRDRVQPRSSLTLALTRGNLRFTRPIRRLRLPALDMLNVLTYLLIGVLVIVSALMVLVVLMQRPKNEGLGASFGTSMTQDLFGAQTTNVLQKFTVYLGGAFFAVCLLLTILYAKASTKPSDVQKGLEQAAKAQAVEAAKTTPAPAVSVTPVPAEAPKASPVATPAPATPAPATSAPTAASSNVAPSPTPSATPAATATP